MHSGRLWGEPSDQPRPFNSRVKTYLPKYSRCETSLLGFQSKFVNGSEAVLRRTAGGDISHTATQ